jgi:hypothetical protein
MAPRLKVPRTQAERDGAEQRALRATRRQLNADARDMFDHTGGDLDQALADSRELGTGEWVRRRNRSAHPAFVHRKGGGKLFRMAALSKTLYGPR